MTLHVPRLPFSFDPLIAEAKRRARMRRWLILVVLVVASGVAVAVLEPRSAPTSGGSGVSPLPVHTKLRISWQARLGTFPIVAYGDGSVWAASGALEPTTNGRLVRLDPRTGKPIAALPVGWWPAEIAVSADAVWVADTIGDGHRLMDHIPGLQNAVTRIDPRTNRVVATIRFPAVQWITVGGGALWVGSGTNSETISRIDPASNRVTLVRRLPGPSEPSVWGGGRLWALTWFANPGLHARVWEIDPQSGRIVASLIVPGVGPDAGLAYRSGVLLLGAGHSKPGHPGGVIFRIGTRHGLSLGRPRLVAGATNLAATRRGVWAAGNDSLLLLGPRGAAPKARLDFRTSGRRYRGQPWVSLTPNVLAASAHEAWVVTQNATRTNVVSLLVAVQRRAITSR